MELFDLPPQRTLGAQVHGAVFGNLPSPLAAALKTTEVAEVVLRLLDAGWRTGQLASRIGALPAGRDPVAEVQELLRSLLPQVPPDQRWQAERSLREAERAGGLGASADRSQASFEEPASDRSRERWIAQIRSDLRSPRRPRVEPTTRVRPPCALCAAQSDYFVTHEVRLCRDCVTLLSTGAVTLSEAG